MKKTLLTLAMALFATTAFAQLNYSDVFPADFSNGLPNGWTLGQGATSEKVEGGLRITGVAQTNGSYRGDIYYNRGGSDAALYFGLNASEYKVFAIQFVGERPNGSLKLSNIDVDPDGWIKGKTGYSLSESGHTDIVDLDGNHTYYWTVGGDKWTGNLTIKQMEIVIADIKNEADKSYTVAWMNWFASADDLRASLNLKKETAVVNSNTNVGYATLTEAWNAAADGDVLKVNEDQTVSSRLDCNQRSLTLEGAEGVKITRTNAGNMMFLANKGGNYNLTVKNLILDGNNQASTANFIEASGSSTVTLENVTIANAKSSNDLGLVVAKSGGKLVLNNLKIEGCEVKENTGEVFCGLNSGLTIGGNNVFSLSLEGTSSVNVDGTLTNTTPISIYKYGSVFAADDVPVNNCTDPSKFKLCGTDLVLKAVDGNLVASTDISSAVETIGDDNSNAPVEYYNLQGVKVTNPEKGIYIMRQGTSVRKVIL